MTINLKMPDITELKPCITVFGVGGAGGNAVNNMIAAGLQGVDFVCANTDAQALATSKSERIIQMGVAVTEGLGAGSHPEVGRAAAEEEEAAEDQRVGADHPLEVLLREPEVELDRRQRDVHDRDVEHDHELHGRE